MTQRTLTRSLAMVVALAALSSLVFAQDCQPQSSASHQHQPSPAVVPPDHQGR